MRIFTIAILLACSFVAKAQTFTWSGYQHIADDASFNVPIVVNGLQNTLDASFGIARVCLNITHRNDADLVVSITSPSGTVVKLIENIGGSGDNFLGTCLGQDGVAFTAAQAPYTGIFFPVGDVSSFNNGQNPNGTWILTVTDVAAPDTGSLHSVYIDFTNNPPMTSGGSGIPVGNYLCGTCVCDGSIPGCDLLPDMTASALEILQNHQEQPGALFISNGTPNIGSGPLDVYGIDSCFCNGVHVPCNTICPSGDQIQHVVKQRIYQKVPGKDTLSYYDRFAGKMTFHPTHGHLHVDNWANYSLRTATSNPDARTWPIVANGTKQSFCLINLASCNANPGACVDNNGNNVLTVPNNGLGWHSGCGLNQGIYPGSYDIYSMNLNDPIPLVNVCNGNYYIVSITDPDNDFLESDETNNWVAVPITLTMQNVIPSIAAASSTVFCQGGSVTLTSTPASNYLWSTGETTQSINVTTAGTFTVSTNCGTSLSTSNAITTSIIPVNSVVSVAVSLTTGNNPTCSGALLVFTATPVNGGSAPIYQWKVNGVAVGTNSQTYSTTTLTNGQVVTCTVTSDISCVPNASAVSPGLTMNITAQGEPAATISITNGHNPSCQGSGVTFTANIASSNSPSYQWKVNGVNVGSNSPTFSSASLTNGQQISCETISSANCPINASLGTAVTVNNTTSDLGAAYPTYYGNGRQQYLIKASELAALGVTKGKINSISFSIIGTLGNPLTLNNYTIKLGQTNTTVMTGAFQTPVLTNVFGPVNYTPVPNSVNRHAFTSPYNWDGVSNLVVDICFANGVYASAAYQNYQTATDFVSTTYYQEDNIGGTDACNRATGPNSGNMRPNMAFNVTPVNNITSNTIVIGVNPTGNVYTFIGTGNWNVPSNWLGNVMPPSVVSTCGEIIVDPASGECILNVPQTVSEGSKITVRTGKKFRVMNNLTVQQ